MKINHTTTNFNGYKNIIYDDIRTVKDRLMFISTQLNDEGHPDLSEFKKLKTMMDEPIPSVHDDVITMIYTYSNNNKPNLFLNDRVLFWGNELRWLKDNRPKAMPLKEYTNIENVHLKAYTLMASITKRIMENSLCSSDSGMNNVISTFMRVMTKFTQDDNASFDILQHAYSSKIPLRHIAENFNQTFVKTMDKFF